MALGVDPGTFTDNRGGMPPVVHVDSDAPLYDDGGLLTDEPITLRNVPQIGDIQTMLQILESLGVENDQYESTITLCARRLGRNQQ